jgi:hypothetical protein
VAHADSGNAAPTPLLGILAAMNVTLDELDADWPRLRTLAEQLAERTGDDPDLVFFPLGLRLRGRHGGQWDDDATPANSTTFASTGGDGVHFSLLHATTTVLLEDAQIKLSSVVSDIFGVSGRAMLEALVALVAGQRDPKVLAQMAKARMRAKLAELEQALRGSSPTTTRRSCG